MRAPKKTTHAHLLISVLVVLVMSTFHCARVFVRMPDEDLSSSASVQLRSTHARFLASTFPDRVAERDPLRPFLGVWKDTSAGVDLVLAPRLRREVSDPGLVLFGTIPGGPWEGALLGESGSTASGAGLTIRARLYLANGTLPDLPVTIVLHASTMRLHLTAENQSFDLVRVADINYEMLATIRIVGHRGLGFARRLQNSMDAFAHTWIFGSSGVEFDITVPYESGAVATIPRPEEMRVHHPYEVRVELLRDDSEALADISSLPTPAAAFEAIAPSGLRFVYLDPKLQWLLPGSPAAAQSALRRLVTLSTAWTAEHPGLHVMIGAERIGDGETADLLVELAGEQPFASGVGWAAEFTRGSSRERFRDYARRDMDPVTYGSGPSVLSFNLMRVRESHQGLLGLLLPDLSRAEEAYYTALPQAVVLWTAYSTADFEGAIRAARRFVGPEGDLAKPVAIMTPYPHRLAYALATVEP